MAGEILKKRREDLGQDILQISDILKVKSDYLEAIERDAFSELPAPVYTMGYIRCYAKYLNVDADSIIELYTKNLAQPKPATIIPVASSQRKTPKIYYVILLSVCVLAVSFFVALSRTKPLETAKVQPVNVPVETIKVQPGNVPAVESVNPGGVGLPQAGNSIPDKVEPGNMPAVESVRPSTSGLPEAKNSIPDSEHFLKIVATESTWILIKFADGKSEEMILKPGDSKGVKFSEKISLKIGNAGGIRIDLDEKDLGIPGNSGQVVTLSLPAI